MTKLFVSENDHEKGMLRRAFFKITTILFYFQRKNKKRNYSSLNNFLNGKMNNTKIIMFNSSVGPKNLVIKYVLFTTASLKINWTTIVNSSYPVTKIIILKNSVKMLTWITSFITYINHTIKGRATA